MKKYDYQKLVASEFRKSKLMEIEKYLSKRKNCANSYPQFIIN